MTKIVACFFCTKPNQKWDRVAVKFVLSQERINKAIICEQHHYDLQHDDFYSKPEDPQPIKKPPIQQRSFHEPREPGSDDA